MTLTEEIGLETFNALPAQEAQEALLACCASPAWAGAVAAARPYAEPADLLSAADLVRDLPESEVSAALAAHPRIGERPTGEDGAWSRREQAGMDTASSETAQAMAEANRRYEERFGHVYLVCATGRSALDLLQTVHERLRHDPGTEQAVVRRELAAITRLRLARLLGEGS